MSAKIQQLFELVKHIPCFFHNKKGKTLLVFAHTANAEHIECTSLSFYLFYDTIVVLRKNIRNDAKICVYKISRMTKGAQSQHESIRM